MLRAVIAGTTWFTERIVTESSPQATGRTRLATMRSDLTLQEQELLSLLTTGYSNGQIAARMNLREQTVRNYVSRLYEKFGVSGRPQLLIALRKLVPDW